MPTPIASQLTGLSTDKLREWTSRRALIPADQRPKRKGSPAKFSWQTILVLRVAVLLRAQSFIALWGKRLVLAPGRTWSFLDAAGSAPESDALLIALDPHLVIIRDGFALPGATEERQLDLFTLPTLHGKQHARSASQRLDDRRAS